MLTTPEPAVNLTPLLAAAALLCAGGQAVMAADNLPDPSFGQNGNAYITPLINEKTVDQAPYVMLHQNHVYVINKVLRQNVVVSRVTRLDQLGVTDPAFGQLGHADLVNLEGFYDDYSWQTGLIDPAGNIYLAGTAKIGANIDMLVCRLLNTGMFDTTWGGKNTGCTTIGFDLVPSGEDYPVSLALQANGRLLVGGTARANIDNNLSNYHAALARLDVSGLPDGSLNGGTAKVSMAIPGWKSFSTAAIAVDSQQRIVIAGTADYPNINGINACDREFGLARLLPNGTVDNTFGAFTLGWDLGPIVDNCAQTDDSVTAGGLTVFPDDSMLLVGSAQFAELGRAIAAVKITKNAEADSSFGGGDGRVHRYVCQVCTYSYITSSKVQSDGKIVIVGATNYGSLYDVFVTRLLADGSDDIEFDGGNALYFGYPINGQDTDESPGTVDVAPGRIVFAGMASTLGQDPQMTLFMTALGSTPQISIFSDGFE